MVILIIGPSGVGKSDYGTYAEMTIVGCHFFDLDKLVEAREKVPAGQLLPKIGNDAFLNLCCEEVVRLSSSDENDIKIIAVGAGALQSSHAREWISKHAGPSIAIMASCEEVYVRGGERNENRALGEFTQVEYSDDRKRIYEAARIQFSVSGLSLNDARSRFANLILGLQNLPLKGNGA